MSEETETTDECPGGGSRSPRDPAFNPHHDFEGTDTCRQCGASKYNEPEDEG